MFRRIVLRLAAFNAVVIALILLASGVATYLVVSQSLASDQETALRQAMNAVDADTLEEVFHQDVNWSGGRENREDEEEEHEREDDHPALPVAITSQYIVFGLKQRPLYPGSAQGSSASQLADTSALRSALQGDPSFGEFEVDDEHYRTFVSPVYGDSGLLGAVQVTIDDEPHHDALGTLRNSLLLVGVVGLFAAVAGGAVLSARGLRPVREAFDRQRAFVADASHQLKTPIAIIRADAEALQRSAPGLDSEDKQLLRDLVESSVFLSDLVNQLLVVARMEGGQMPMAHERLDLRELAEDAVRTMQHVAGAHKVVLTADRGQHPIVIMGDPTQLRLALLALIDNAIKYNVPDGSVDVAVAREDGWGMVTVSDTGVGIATEDRERIWERFYRSADARGSSVDGAGLGLPIIREVVSRHRGEVSLTSAPGQGTEIVVRLRLA
jgi:signal transduction histidine kinase